MFRRSFIIPALAALAAAVLATASSAGSSTTAAGPRSAPPPGLAAALAALERHADSLLDMLGVAGTGVGLDAAGRPVIRIYVESDNVAGVPASLEGVSVQRVKTGIVTARAPTDRFPRPVPIGVSSGHPAVTAGTLGARVTDGTNVYALSNNHVYANINSASIGDGVIQPGTLDGGTDPADRIGTLANFQTITFDGSPNTIDAAIALSSPANVGTATPADGYGPPSPTTTTAFVGQSVQKYGRTTGLTTGTVAEVDVTVDVCYAFFIICFQEARFVNQISVTPGAFSAGGDSGSLIVTQGGNQPVALLFAGGEGRTIGNPIDLVLSRFNVTIDGSAQPITTPGEPTGLIALSGDAAADLSWQAPSFDGGSPITGYKLYRGTTSGSKTLLANVGTVTSFVDVGLENGTTYYYEVSAENEVGEGPRSNEVSATPSAAVPPVEPLSVLDDFDRSDENPLSHSGHWTNGVIGAAESGLQVLSNQLACTKTTTCTAWRNDAQHGPDTEATARITTLPGNGNTVRLYVRLQTPGSSAVDGYMLLFSQASSTDQVVLYRISNGALTVLTTFSQEIAAGDRLLLRAQGSRLEAWRHDGSVWARVGQLSDSTYASEGFVGVGIRGTTGRVDDFGGPQFTPPPPAPPDAPTALTILGDDGGAHLAWAAPASDGGSPITGYRIHRGTSPGGETLLTSVGPVTSFDDTGLTNGSAYYYTVSAVNTSGEGAQSTEAQATVGAFVPLDTFNRPNENPLSDSGRWSNGILNSGERGLRVVSNRLGGTKSTTTTAWRNTSQYGPDAEVWTGISTRPGNGNAVRLYVRLQKPGSSAVDGYMLLYSQASGTDHVALYRISNGALTALTTFSHELAAGDRLLLRAQGSALEAWRQSGSDWSRLGLVNDATYASAGFVGVGIRGTTGRLDDFGGR